MILPTRLAALAALATLVSGASITTVPPAQRGTPHLAQVGGAGGGELATAQKEIALAVELVDQKRGPALGDAPNLAVPATLVTAVDGELTSAGQLAAITESGLRRARTALRLGGGGGGATGATSLEVGAKVKGYEMVFGGTGASREARDSSVQGTAYLTYATIPNSTYNIEACLDFCSSTPQCVFANLYYEYNNRALDLAGDSNLKCAVYGDVHSAVEKTNFGGQQSYPEPAPLVYIQQSTGWAKASEADLVGISADVEGYELEFGPLDAANNAPGYAGFVFLDRYDVAACARACNEREADADGGSCQFFNIWRAVVNDVPTTYTCSLYYIPTDASTATNFGQGELRVTLSRGYKRTNLLPDGGFEAYTGCRTFCYTESSAHWTGDSDSDSSQAATIFFYAPYARTGNASALLGSATGRDDAPGTLSPRAGRLPTVPGRAYEVAFWQNSAYAGEKLQAGAWVDVLWNGDVVLRVRPGYQKAWTWHRVAVVGGGGGGGGGGPGDVLQFRGGKAPAWTFLDDVTVFAL